MHRACVSLSLVHIAYLPPPFALSSLLASTLTVRMLTRRAPDTARTKAKMMYASTKDFFKGFLDGISVELQASELEDITEKDIADTVRSSVTRQ